jgi:hypothetical protein
MDSNMSAPGERFELGGYVNANDFSLPEILDLNLSSPSLKLFALGRHCIEAVFRARQPKNIYAPRYTCHSVKTILQKLSGNITYYSLDENFIPVGVEAGEDDLFIVNNYFGLSGQTKIFRDWIYLNTPTPILIDNTQSMGIENQFANYLCFTSPRKFLPITDGGILYDHADIVNEGVMPKHYDISWPRMEWLFRSIDEDARMTSYSDYLRYRGGLQDLQYSKMSLVTQHMLKRLHIRDAIKLRIVNFNYLNACLPIHSVFSSLLSFEGYCPIGFPIFVKDSIDTQRILAQSKIFSVRFWPELIGDPLLNDYECRLMQSLLILPINRKFNEGQIAVIKKQIDHI